MIEVKCQKLWRWTLKLRCRTCGKKVTFYIADKKNVPTESMNGWYIKNTELCPLCAYDKKLKKIKRIYPNKMI